MRIAQIQKLVNKSQFARSTTPVGTEDLFAYLNSLILGFQSAKQNFFGEMEIDFQEPLKTVANTSQLKYDPGSKTETEDFNLVRNLNVIDFAGFLDTLIRTVAIKNPDVSNLRDLAAKNIFRTHINKPVLEKSQSMFFEDKLEAWTKTYRHSLSSLQIALEIQNLQQLMSDPSRNHFYIFDIDGTLKHNEEGCLDHAVPNIGNEVREDLIALSKKPNTKVLILTSRTVEEICESNIPYKQIPAIAGYGRESIHGNERRFLQDCEFIDETKEFAKHLQTFLLKTFNLEEGREYLLRQYAGSISIQFRENVFSSTKVSVMRELELLMQNNPKGWSVIDNGNKTIFLAHKESKCHKGIGLKQILEENKNEINENTNIYVLGDTSSDYEAMKALKEADLPQGVNRINIAVGEKLPKGKYPDVDEKIKSHHALVDLLGWLAI